ncbi:MAG: protein kinase [Pseudomonadota bacterium]
MAHADEVADKQSPSGAGRVLVVDDAPDLRRALRRVLVQGGFQVTVAERGSEAISLVKQSDFELIVSDVRMPDMDGIELLRLIHEFDPDLPVLLISGNPDLPSALQAVEFGAFEYVQKPVDLEKLRLSAGRAVHLRRRRVAAQEAVDSYRSGERERRVREQQSDGLSGELLAGRYRIGKMIGQGGMGTVYEAVREDLGNMRVAIKILHDSVSSNRQLVARFRREAETVALLSHPNIVRVIDFHDHGGEPAFLVMEWLDGLSLGQVLQRQGPMTVARTASVACQVLAALSAAHRANVVHRDLKPDNIFLTRMSGQGEIVKLLDFGVAKLLAASGSPKLTETGVVLGTPPYMAPEHARGAEVDLRSDVYAVGCVMYEALTAHAPFAAENYNALLFAIQEGCPVPLEERRPELDPELVRIIRKAMAVKPDQRFQSAQELAEALQPWLNAGLSGAPPPESSPLAFAPTMLPPSSELPERKR